MRPEAQRAFPGADPVGPAGHRGSAIALLECGTMRGQGCDIPVRAQYGRGDLSPEGRAGDMRVENVMNGDRVGRHGTPGIDETGSGFAIETPATVGIASQILPADLAHVVRAVPARLEVDDADARGRRLHAPEIGKRNAGGEWSKRGTASPARTGDL